MSHEAGKGTVLWEMDRRGVATVTLNRPKVNNAYNGDMIAGLHEAMDLLGAKEGLRAVVIRGNGRHFQAGADLEWIAGVGRRRAGGKRTRLARHRRSDSPSRHAAGANRGLDTRRLFWWRHRHCLGVRHRGGSRQCRVRHYRVPLGADRRHYSAAVVPRHGGAQRTALRVILRAISALRRRCASDSHMRFARPMNSTLPVHALSIPC